MGVFQGYPKPENLDKRQAYGIQKFFVLNFKKVLAATGCVWTYYALIVSPANYLLCACNAALLGTHGYNLYRRNQYYLAINTFQMGKGAIQPRKERIDFITLYISDPIIFINTLLNRAKKYRNYLENTSLEMTLQQPFLQVFWPFSQRPSFV